MTTKLLRSAETDLADAFDNYEAARPGLGGEFITEFRRGVDHILAFPRGWQALDAVYRRYRLHRFPYGIIYRIDEPTVEVVIVAMMHLSRDPDTWRKRLP